MISKYCWFSTSMMVKIAFLILLIAIIVNGEEDICDCSCEGTRQNEGIPICSMGKCKCKPGYSGKNCQTCFIPSNRSCKTCDCPTSTNECEQTTMFDNFLQKFKELNRTDFKSIDQPPLNLSQMNDFKLKIQKLIDDIKNNEEIDLLPLNEMKNQIEHVAKDVRELLKKYHNEDLLKEDVDKIIKALKIIQDIFDTINDIKDQDNIIKLAEDAHSKIGNITDILNEHDKCLDVIHQFCSGKNTTENLMEIKRDVEGINLKSYFDRIDKNIEDVEDVLRMDTMNRKNLNEITIPNIPKFDEIKYKKNHGILEEINSEAEDIRQTEMNVTKLFDEAKENKQKSNLLKETVFNTILMAPAAEIQDIIDNVTHTIDNSLGLVNELLLNKTKLEEQQANIESTIKAIEEKLKGFETKRDQIKSDLELQVHVPDNYTEIISKMKENLENLTGEYVEIREKYNQFGKQLEDDFEKMKTVLGAETECMKVTTEEADAKIDANNEIMDALERDLDNAEKFVVLLERVEEAEEEKKIIEKMIDDLASVQTASEETLLCPKYDLA